MPKSPLGFSTPVTLADAILVVLTDQRESHSQWGPATAIGHVLNTVSVDTLDEDNATAIAYRQVLAAKQGELVIQVALMLEIGLNVNDLHVDKDGFVEVDGMDAFDWLIALGEDDES